MENPPRRSGLTTLLILVLIAASIFVISGRITLKIIYNAEIEKQNETAKLLKEIVSVGMDIDVAISLLKSNEFEVGEKYNPTGESGYIVVHVKLFRDLTVIDNFAETFGLSWTVGRGYATLEAKADNIIYNIVF